MANIKDTLLLGGGTLISPESGDDVQTVTITRAQARAYFDGQELGGDFETALDLAQATASDYRSVIMLVIEQEPV